MNKEKIQGHVMNSISVCEEIVKLYNHELNAKSVSLIRDTPN